MLPSAPSKCSIRIGTSVSKSVHVPGPVALRPEADAASAGCEGQVRAAPPGPTSSNWNVVTSRPAGPTLSWPPASERMRNDVNCGSFDSAFPSRPSPPHLAGGRSAGGSQCWIVLISGSRSSVVR